VLEPFLPAIRSAGFLSPGQPVTIAAAPGRLDVMGGIADYSGATVLEATIGDLAVVALQQRTDSTLRVRTVGPAVAHLPLTEHTLSLNDLYRHDSLISYEAARALFTPESRWAAYVIGVFYVLLAERAIDRFPHGADLLVLSSVPLGAGVASSAAIEVATMRAVCAAFGITLDLDGHMRLASLCQVAENRVVGAPCGIMDQVTCSLGRAGRLLALRCQPHDVLGFHAPPEGFSFVGLDSGVKHAVGGVRYPRVRCAAFMGRRIIQETLRARGDDPSSAQHLARLTPAQYRAHFRDLLPARMEGRAFVERWGHTDDPATTVLLDESYPVRGATEHPIYENARVRRFAALLEQGTPQSLTAAGRLMYGSHRSYSRNCGLGSKETDLLVSLVRSRGVGRGLYGAKITGGGSGGTVAIMRATSGAAGEAADGALAEVRREYERAVGRAPRVIEGSSPGAAQIEPLRVTL
jgi:L-arabinokinase